MDRLNKIGMSHSDPAAGKILGLMFKHRPSLRRGHVTCYMQIHHMHGAMQIHSITVSTVLLSLCGICNSTFGFGLKVSSFHSGQQ